ncbi:hypothetical protein HWB52_gp85 [Pseudomonas phage Littlefix]|uniref:Uncharacterized protein n=1 Tax=Pseudomonas phage Littlefix TaxID=2079289 RepID=A0A2K9VHU3_9CAUD|nr:hypothetical protein HWB52_gp85 [Pseudomonas phage Littlefix]AUV61900.1 hypothetical protein PsPhLittlefix_gp85 [Pseudomonas phage Littlefix]
MNLQTVVYDEDEEYSKSIIMDLCNTGAVTACCEGDAIQQRDEALAWATAVTEANKVAHLFNSGSGMMMHLQQEYGKALMALEESMKKEPNGS